MNSDIPDDVVERAFTAYRENYRTDGQQYAHVPALRAALRVAVEWERDNWIRAMDSVLAKEQSCLFRNICEAAAIRARGEK